MGRSGGGGGGGGGRVSGGGYSGGRVTGGGSHHGPSSPRGGGRSGGGFPMGGGPSFGGGFPFGGRPMGRPMGRPYVPRPMVGPIFVGRGPRMGTPPPMAGGPAARRDDGAGGCFGCGCASTILAIVSLFLIFAFFAFMLNLCSGPSGVYQASTVSEIPASTQEREPLPLDEAQQTALYQDADGSWIDDPAAMEKGLREFWQKTGVYPFVFIVPNGTLTTPDECSQLADEIYPKITDDRVHLVLVFCDDDQGGFVYGYSMGPDVPTVLDNEAMGILAAYLGRYYDTAATEEEIFSDAFADTADRIMHVEQPWYVAAAPVLIVAGVVVGILAIIFAVRTKRREQEAHVREVLNRPLERYGDSELEDLERKYGTAADASDSSLEDREADLEARYADLERRERDLRDGD